MLAIVASHQAESVVTAPDRHAFASQLTVRLQDRWLDHARRRFAASFEIYLAPISEKAEVNVVADLSWKFEQRRHCLYGRSLCCLEMSKR